MSIPIRLAMALTDDEPSCADDDCEACKARQRRRDEAQDWIDGLAIICPGCGRNGNEYCARGCPEATAKGYEMDPIAQEG